MLTRLVKMHTTLIARIRLLALSGLAVFLAALPRESLAQNGTRADSAGVAQTARDFLTAFDSLHWEPFTTFWAVDATVFLPDADAPHLLVGRTAVLGYFRSMFNEVRGTAAVTTPTLGILPALQDLRVQLVGPTAALVTFELGRGKNPGRRTTVWHWNSTSQSWQLVHIHASTLATDPPQAPS